MKLSLFKVLIGVLAIIISMAMGLFLLWLSWDTIRPIPKAVATEGTVIHKYYDSASRRKWMPDKPIMIYSYDNSYWSGRPQKPVRTQNGMMIAKTGRVARQEVGSGFYKRTNIGDKVTVEYRASSDVEDSAIKGGLPFGRLIFRVFSGVFLIGFSIFFILNLKNISRTNHTEPVN